MCLIDLTKFFYCVMLRVIVKYHVNEILKLQVKYNTEPIIHNFLKELYSCDYVPF